MTAYYCPRCKVPGRVGLLGPGRWFCHRCAFQWQGGPYGGWDTPTLTLDTMQTLWNQVAGTETKLTSAEYSQLEKEIAEGTRLLKQALEDNDNAR